MRMARRRVPVLLSIVTATVTLSACSGPQVPLDVGIKEVPGDIVLGGLEPIAKSVPVPPVSLPVSPPAVDDLVARTDDAPSDAPDQLPDDQPASSPPSRPPPGEPTEPICPSADPRTAPAREARNRIALPPAEGTYQFRNEGRFEVSGANAVRGTFPVEAKRLVRNAVRFTDPGSSKPAWFRFQVEASLTPLASTTTTYTLIPERSEPGPRPGLYISRVRTEFEDGTQEDFKPSNFPGLLLLPFPAVRGEAWETSGVDPRSGMAMAFRGRVGAKQRIDACGELLDAILVHIDGEFGPAGQRGVAVSPNAVTNFIAEYGIGTQFGGLLLLDRVDVVREYSTGTVHHRNQATIGGVPKPPDADVPECGTDCIPP